MFGITIESVGMERFVRGFRLVGEKAKDMRPVFERIREDFHQVESGLLATEGRSEGLVWPALSTRYWFWKHEYFPGRRMLYLFGILTASLTGKAEYTVDRIEEREAEFGSSAPTASWHQHGTSRMPKREVVKLSETTKKRWGRFFVQHIKDVFNESNIGAGI